MTMSHTIGKFMSLLCMWQDGKLVRTLPGHGHWVNTLALSTEHILRAGPHDEYGNAPESPGEALKVGLSLRQQARAQQDATWTMQDNSQHAMCQAAS